MEIEIDEELFKAQERRTIAWSEAWDELVAEEKLGDEFWDSDDPVPMVAFNLRVQKRTEAKLAV